MELKDHINGDCYVSSLFQIFNNTLHFILMGLLLEYELIVSFKIHTLENLLSVSLNVGLFEEFEDRVVADITGKEGVILK